MKEQAPEYLVVGHLNKAHGTKGELFAWPLTDDGERTFVRGAQLTLGDEQGNVQTVPATVLEVETVRPYRRGFLLKFVGIDDRTSAEVLRDRYVLRPFAEVSEREEGEFFYHELLGMVVVTADGERVGMVREVYELAPHHMLDVQRDGHADTLLVPMAEGMILSIELEERQVVISPPPGFLDL